MDTHLTLTVGIEDNEGGTVTKNPNLANYPSGTVVTLTVYPSLGWDFVQWKGTDRNDVEYVSGHTYKITMNSYKNITADFDPD